MFDKCEFTECEYNKMYNLYKNGLLPDKEWNEYCFEMLEHLMNLNKKVLDNLKNR